uniref:Reverse transcriptase domain-containing protein n=1 Tax=Tanacetum cinerariifolium TaxID=118510 RepID=A0A699IMJ1_TANCI|nr:reverse transcriptase domain-containing protein [Tanacetum cinerariifolium]
MVNTRTNAELAAAVQNALQTLLPQIRVEIREEFRTGYGPSAPVDTKNWISHMEKIFDVMGYEDAFKTRLAVYKFEGDALAWWKAYKQAKGGDERLKREYHSIRQTDTETSTEFMQRSSGLRRFFRYAMFIYSCYLCYVLSLYPFTELYAQPYFLSCLIRQGVTIGDANHSTRPWMNFMIVRSLSPYNCIIGRPGIKEIQAVPSTAHGMLKFPVDGGIVTIRRTILIPEVAIGGTLSAKGHTELCSLLMENLDIFAWQPSDMTGIQLAESDEEKTAFHTGQGVYCYTKIPYGLKNAGATYQRLVDKAFDSQIGQNIEVYIDDLVVKSHIEAEMLRDIGETFRTLRKINMKLNPKKCTFGAVEGMFLGYTVTLEGIKPYPDKTEFVLQLPSGTSLQATKENLTELPLLVAPKPKEELIVYLSASYGAISAVLMTERGTVQMPVYFVSCALQGPELNYTLIEKQVLSLVFAAKRPRRTIKKMERHAVRTQYYIPAKDVGERTGLSGFPCRNARRKSARRISSRNSTRAVDTLHRWIGIRGREGGKKAPYQGPTVRIIRGGSLQAVIPYAVVKVRRTTPSKVEELPHVLWAHRTMIKSSHDDTPFSLTYGTEVVIPAKIRMPTYRTAAVDIVHNDEELRLNLDFLEERRERAAIREAKAKLKMTKYYNARVRGVTFRPGDFVYRSNDASHAVDGGKLGPK